MKNFQHNENSHYFDALQMDRLKVKREDYLNVAKVLDLQAFGNSILEMMVGQCQEEIRMKDT